MPETIIPSPVTPWRHLVLTQHRNTPPSAPPFDTTYLAIIDDGSTPHSRAAAVIANIEVDPIALRLAVIGPEVGDSVRSLTRGDDGELAEDRVEAFLDEFTEVSAADGGNPDLFSEGFVNEVRTSDFREVLRELRAWRALAGARLDIITRLAEDLAGFVDPAPQEQTGGNA